MGPTLFELIRQHGRLDLMTAASITLAIIKHLRILHKHDIMHGDIHPGNVALVGATNYNNLRLLDFGMAMNRNYLARMPKSPSWGILCEPYMSVWELSGGDRSFRDDVYRSVQMMAVLVYGYGYKTNMEKLCGEYSQPGDVAAFYALKNAGNFFETEMIVPQKHGPRKRYTYRIKRTGIPPVSEPLALHLVDKLVRVARRPSSPAATPNYTCIEELLSELIALSDFSAEGVEANTMTIAVDS